MKNLFCQKRWKKRDTSDPEWEKLGDTPDARRQRADSIERECRQFWLTIVTTVFIVVVTIIISLR